MRKSEDIQIADIETELTRLWEAQNDPNRIRASLFNLILYTKSNKLSDYMHQIANAIVQRFPCRIIFIEENCSPDENYIRVSVANEVVGKGTESISCDQIRIEVSDNHIERVPFIILPHLLPDLPIYLYWIEDPTVEKKVLPHLLPYGTRLIFDAGSTKDLQAFSKRMLADLERSKEIYIDVNWLFSEGWRVVLEKAFDSEEKLAKLQKAETLEITYNNENVSWCYQKGVQAIYIAAWIASRLKWTFLDYKHENECHQLRFKHDSTTTLIYLKGKKIADCSPTSIYSISLKGNDEELSIDPFKDFSKVTIHSSNKESCELPYSIPLAGIKKGFPFTSRLLFSNPTPQYKEILTILAQIPWQ